MLSKPLLIALLLIPLTITATNSAETRPGLDEQALKQRYDAFVKALDDKRIATDYPKAVEKLDSPDPKVQIAGIKTLAATDEIEAIPWIVPFVDSEDRHVRIYAGQALNALVATHQLKRRDKTQSNKVVILPPRPGEIDLKPVSWVIWKMLQMPDDGNTHAFAANMIGYGGFEEYEADLRRLLKSKHPAVTTAARRALEMLGVDQEGAFTETELEAAKATGESFAQLFRNEDEDRLGLLLVPKGSLSTILNPRVLAGKDVDSLYAKMVTVNTQRFTEFRSMCGDLTKVSSTRFQPGRKFTSDFYAPGVRAMKNSYVVLAYANRVEIKVKIEEMVFVGNECYIVEID